MDKLKNRWIKHEQERKEKVIQTLLYSVDYYLMSLHIAKEQSDETEIEICKSELKLLHEALTENGHYA